MGQLRPLFRLFSSFQTNITILTTNKCEVFCFSWNVCISLSSWFTSWTTLLIIHFYVPTKALYGWGRQGEVLHVRDNLTWPRWRSDKLLGWNFLVLRAANRAPRNFADSWTRRRRQRRRPRRGKPMYKKPRPWSVSAKQKFAYLVTLVSTLENGHKMFDDLYFRIFLNKNGTA